MPDDPDGALGVVLAKLVALSGDGSRWDRVIRGTYDQLYDGQRTGRYEWKQLYKTEKTHFGTLVEINAQREFRFSDGVHLDYSIEDHDVDCKFSHSANWMLPPEAIDQLCLVVTASDENSTFSVGLVRASQHALRAGANRDAKVGLSAQGKGHIQWVHRHTALTPNLLLQLSHEDRTRIMDTRLSGQGRVNMLFRIAQHSPVTRTVVATVAQQDDYMKRVRYNGGARSALREEGVVILGGDYEAHRAMARALDLPLPSAGSFVSARLARAEPSDVDVVSLDGELWRLADDNDPIVRAPLVPSTRGGK